jgi:hypothetical protein
MCVYEDVSLATSSEQCSLLAVQCSTTQAAFQVAEDINWLYSWWWAYWCPKHVEAIKLHTLSHLVGSLPSLWSAYYTYV